MNTQEIALVQSSFAQLTPLARVADLFYARLFQVEPSVRSYFENDLREEKVRWSGMLESTITSLKRGDEPALAAQALRVARGELEPHHYETVAAAWFWTLEQTLGEAFTSDVQAAWVAFYQLVS